MTDLPEFDELLSAYLDDELSPEDKQHVEQSLHDDRELRQTLEELQALRAAIQALPQMKLDRDFVQRVLERAEQNVRRTEPPRDGKASPLDLASPPSSGARWSRKPGLQSVAIASATLAALILVAVILPQRWTRSNIARHAPPIAQDRNARLYERDWTEQDDLATVDKLATDGPTTEDPFAGSRRRETTLAGGERLGKQAELAFDAKSFGGMARSPEGLGTRRGGTVDPQSTSAASPLPVPPQESAQSPKSAPTLAPAASVPREMRELMVEDVSGLALQSAASPAANQHWSRGETLAAGDGLPPAALSDYVVFVSGSNPQRISNTFRTALVQNHISEMPTAVEKPASGQETEVQLVLVEAPLSQIQATVKTLRADRTNVQSILALSQRGDGHRVVSDAEDFGMLSGFLGDGESWDDTLDGAERAGQEPEMEGELEDLRSSQLASQTDVAGSKPKTQSYLSEPTKSNVRDRSSSDLAQLGRQPAGKGQAWFFSYAAEGDGRADRGSRTASRMSRSRPQPSPGGMAGTSVEAGDLAAEFGRGAGDMPDSTMQDMGEVFLRERELLRKRIDNLKLPDTPDTSPEVEKIRRRSVAKDVERNPEDLVESHRQERDVAASGVANHDMAEQTARILEMSEKDADQNVEAKKSPRVPDLVSGGRAIATDSVALGLETSKGIRTTGPPTTNSKMVRVLFVLQPVDANVPAAASEEAR